IIKLHPLLEQKNPEKFYPIIKYADRKNIVVVHDFPAVFPILSRVDLFLGDFSSVGYDFLAFERPMGFVMGDKKSLLHTCGAAISHGSNIYKQLENLKEKR